VLAALCAGWHAPLFFILASYAARSSFPGFFIGLTAGALVLSSLYNGTGASILAVAVWHASYNLSAATAADGIIAAITTTCVIFGAVSLVQRERAGQPALDRSGVLR
jgi:hypothetical protein